MMGTLFSGLNKLRLFPFDSPYRAVFAILAGHQVRSSKTALVPPPRYTSPLRHIPNVHLAALPQNPEFPATFHECQVFDSARPSAVQSPNKLTSTSGAPRNEGDDAASACHR
jgi:hypothetical protein